MKETHSFKRITSSRIGNLSGFLKKHALYCARRTPDPFGKLTVERHGLDFIKDMLGSLTWQNALKVSSMRA